MEIVTRPDLRSGREASDFLDYLRRVLLYLALCDGNMEEGSLRCDANVSVRPRGETSLGTKTEIKNLNSFRFLNKALGYEIRRQIRVLESGRQVVQETRLWEEDLEETRPMRSKEEAHDYRYFPDPDLLPVVIPADRLDQLRTICRNFREHARAGSVPSTVSIRVTPRGHPDARVCRLLRSIREECRKPQDGSELDGRGCDHRLKRDGLGLHESPVKAADLGELIRLLDDGAISGKMARASSIRCMRRVSRQGRSSGSRIWPRSVIGANWKPSFPVGFSSRRSTPWNVIGVGSGACWDSL